MTDHQLNHALATDLMLWHVWGNLWVDEYEACTGYAINHEMQAPYWNPAGDWGCVGEVVKRIGQLDLCLTWEIFPEPEHYAVIRGRGERPSRATVWAETPERTLCMAALAAVRGERSTTNAR